MRLEVWPHSPQPGDAEAERTTLTITPMLEQMGLFADEGVGVV